MFDATLSELYEVEATLGRGTAGVVYRAYDRRTQRRVAIKQFVRPEKKGADFFRELIMANRLTHPHIVRVLNMLLSSTDLRYIVYEYMDRGSLRTRLRRRGPVSVATAVSILEQVSRGLHFAHTQGLAHCDIKPENILACSVGGSSAEMWKLTDFGLAQNLTPESRRSTAGTPAYMAPEQFRIGCSHASDLYALGVVLYELLVGSRPFSGTRDQLREQHASAAPDLGRIEHAGCRELAAHLLAKRPEDRPSSAAALLEIIEHLHRGLPSASLASLETPSDLPSDVHITLSGSMLLIEEDDVLGEQMGPVGELQVQPGWECDLPASSDQLLLAGGESGVQLLVHSEQTIQRIDAQTGQCEKWFRLAEPGLVCSQEHHPFVFCVDQSRLRQYDLNGEQIRRWPVDPGALSISVSPSCERVAIAYRDAVLLLNIATRRLYRIRSRRYEPAVAPAFTRDGLLVMGEHAAAPAVVFVDECGTRLARVPLAAVPAVLATGAQPAAIWTSSFARSASGPHELVNVALGGRKETLSFSTAILRLASYGQLLLASDLQQQAELFDARSDQRLTVSTEQRIRDLVLLKRQQMLVLLMQSPGGPRLRSLQLQRSPNSATLTTGDTAYGDLTASSMDAPGDPQAGRLAEPSPSSTASGPAMAS